MACGQGEGAAHKLYSAAKVLYSDFAVPPLDTKIVPPYNSSRRTSPSGEARYPSATSPQALPLSHLSSLIVFILNRI